MQTEVGCNPIKVKKGSKVSSNHYRFRKEIELLLACTGVQPEAEKSAAISLIAQQSLDWNFLIQTARIHNLKPLLYWHLEAYCRKSVPEKVFEELEKANNENTFHNLRLFSELITLVNRFNTSNIPVLAFKGPLLAELAFGSIFLRKFNDLDVLIPEDEIEKAKQILIDEGLYPQFDLNEAQQDRYTRQFYEMAFTDKNRGITVDLHWSLLPKNFSFSPCNPKIWERAQSFQIGGAVFQTLSVEDLLLYLCAHAAKDNWSSLGSLCDIARLVKNNSEINWKLVCSEAGKLGSQRTLLVGLLLAHSLLGLELPAKVTTLIKTNYGTEKLVRRVVSLLFQPKDKLLSWYLIDNFYLKSMDKSRDKLQYWIDEVLTPGPYDWAVIRLPGPLTALYYPLRSMRFTIKYASKILEVALGRVKGG